MAGNLQVGQYLAKHPYLFALGLFAPAFLIISGSSSSETVWLVCNTTLMLFALSNPLLGAFDSRMRWYLPISLVLFAGLGYGLVYLTRDKIQVDIFTDIAKRMQLMLACVSFILVHIIVAVFRLLRKFMEAN